MTRAVAVVTGGTSGIGLSIAESLSASGYTVVAVGRSASKIEAATGRLQDRVSAGQLEFRALDLRQTEHIAEFISDVVRRHGRLDVLVNAAGILTFQNTHEVSAESLDEQFDILFKATFICTVTGLPHMMAGGGGVVINIGSIAAEKASPKMAVYAAAKAAVANFTKTIALEYAGKGVRAICISPGAVETNLMDKVMFAIIQKKNPLKRLGQPSEIAALVNYLLSEPGAYVTGAVLTIDGGSSL